MRPSAWHPPVEPSFLEQTIITRIKRAKLYVFLRHHCHELFNDAFQEELATLYAPSLRGPLIMAQAPSGNDISMIFDIIADGTAFCLMLP
jgi:hypothetical protein